MPKNESSVLSSNKKAFAEYDILEKIEAGIQLSGPEVKSIRAGRANLKGSYIEVNHNEAYTKNIHISPYKFAEQPDYDPLHGRKLLLHKTEIAQLEANINKKGITVVPLDFHLKNNRIKLLIGICRGKKQYDRRQELKKKANDLEVRRALRNR